MNKVFTIEEIRTIIHKELAAFMALGKLAKNQDRHRQVLISYGTQLLLKLMAEFERVIKVCD